MRHALLPFALIMIAGCQGEAGPPTGPVAAKADAREARSTAPVPPPAPPAAPAADPAREAAFDRFTDDGKAVLLCDPKRSRLSIRSGSKQASLAPDYPNRREIDPDDLVEFLPSDVGEEQFRRALVRYERCGPLVVKLSGDFLNRNIQGEMGAFAPFVAVEVSHGKRRLYPASGKDPVRLTECDVEIRRWLDCPERYAVRIDLDHVPGRAGEERLLVHEWVRSGDVIDGRMAMSERRFSLKPNPGMRSDRGSTPRR